MNLLLFLFFFSVIPSIYAKLSKEKDSPWYSSRSFNQAKLPKAYNWMKRIQSSISLSSLAIPGTHDTCTDAFKSTNPIDKEIIKRFTRTQSWPLSDQLKAGIRYLDIRAGSDGNIYHGAYQTKSTFQGVFATVSSFLAQNPSEGVIMRINLTVKKKCKSKECIETNIIKVMDQYSAILFLRDAIPVLGEIRGKVFVIADKFEYRRALKWGSSLITLQDQYQMIGEPHIVIAKKKKAILEYIMRGKTRTEFIINHCSGAGAPIITISGIAIKTNQVPYDESGFSGIIAMDYPGEGLIAHLLNQNKQFELSSNDSSELTDFFLNYLGE